MSTSRHIVTDIETFGTSNNALVLSIGAVVFDLATGEIMNKFHFHIDPKDQLNREISYDTVKWWMKQSDDARNKLINPDVTIVSLKAALLAYTDFLLGQGQIESPLKLDKNGVSDKIYNWGNGNMFDNVILRDLYKDAGMVYPVHYRNDFDMRTLKYVHHKQTGENETEYSKAFKEGTAHDALDDAIYQAKVISYIVNWKK